MKESEKKTDDILKEEETSKESVVQKEEPKDYDMPNKGSCSPEFQNGCINPEEE